MDMAAQPTPLIRSDNNGVTTLTLNRPNSRNALSIDLISALQTELNAIGKNREISTVVISANGPAFCSGHDLKEIRENENRKAYKLLFTECSELMIKITQLPQPVIARVHGPASAAGCQLVATCDLAVASYNSTFATPGVNIGLFCSTPMVALSRNIGQKQAMEMLLLGDSIDATTAQRFGLVNKTCSENELDAIVNEWCNIISSKSQLTIKIGKIAFYNQLNLPLQQAYDYAANVMVENMLAGDALEGIDAFLEKRKPIWRGK